MMKMAFDGGLARARPNLFGGPIQHLVDVGSALTQYVVLEASGDSQKKSSPMAVG